MQLLSDIKNYQTIIAATIAALIAIIGWICIAKKNREHEEFKLRLIERFKVRKGMLDSYIAWLVEMDKVIVKYNDIDYKRDVELVDKLKRVNWLIEIYGTTDEKERMEKLAKSLAIPDNGSEIRETIKSLTKVVLNSIKFEYDLKKLN
ncbi:MAG TPA: hypothetical protein VG603_09440 [Chitinophagales bacterium]|nr:hypothetical protein [Chitinophagales bacterium]